MTRVVSRQKLEKAPSLLAAVPPALLFLLLCTCGHGHDEERSGPRDESPFAPVAGSFLENRGQIGNAEVLYYHGAGPLQIGFAESALLLRITELPPSGGPARDRGIDGRPAETRPVVNGALVGLTFRGANRVRPEGRGKLDFPTHFLRGADPARWRRNVPSFREVVYPELYEGIDLVYRIGADGLKYEFHLLPGADPGRIELHYDGVQRVEIDPGGGLVVGTTAGEILDSAPIALLPDSPSGSASVLSETSRAARIRTSYVLRSPASVGFSVEGWDGESPLVIDPLLYSTYLGGIRTELIRSAVADADGFVHVAGWTNSKDFPATRGAFQEFYHEVKDAFVARLKKRKVAFVTFLGGTDRDDAYVLKLGENGDIIVAGETGSSDFPVTDGSTYHGGIYDVFVARLDRKGENLLYGTYIGGALEDYSYSLDVDGAGAAYIVGQTRSEDFPVTAGAFDTTFHGGGFDAYVAKVDTMGGGLVWATYLGGRSVDFAWSVAVDPSGDLYVAGSTISVDFPVTAGSFDATYNGTQDAYVTKLTGDGSGLVYSGFIGGLRFDRAFAIDLDDTGAALVTGVTRSDDFPATAGAYQEAYGGADDGFIVKVAPSGASLEFATYLGGTAPDKVNALFVDPVGTAYLTGFTASTDFPVTPGALDETHNGGFDAFVTTLTAGGESVTYSTYLGGSSTDGGYGITLSPSGDPIVVGETRSTDFPVRKAIDDQLTGTRDCFLSKIRQ